MNIIEQSEYYRIYWHDEDQSILIGEAFAGWTWEDAQSGIVKLNEIAGHRAQETPVFVIIYLMKGGQLLPKQGSSLAHMRKLLLDDPDHEDLTIYVTESNIIQTMLQLANRLNGLFHLVPKLHFAPTLERAFQIIEQYKSSN